MFLAMFVSVFLIPYGGSVLIQKSLDKKLKRDTISLIAKIFNIPSGDIKLGLTISENMNIENYDFKKELTWPQRWELTNWFHCANDNVLFDMLEYNTIDNLINYLLLIKNTIGMTTSEMSAYATKLFDKESNVKNENSVHSISFVDNSTNTEKNKTEAVSKKKYDVNHRFSISEIEKHVFEEISIESKIPQKQLKLYTEIDEDIYSGSSLDLLHLTNSMFELDEIFGIDSSTKLDSAKFDTIGDVIKFYDLLLNNEVET